MLDGLRRVRNPITAVTAGFNVSYIGLLGSMLAGEVVSQVLHRSLTDHITDPILAAGVFVISQAAVSLGNNQRRAPEQGRVEDLRRGRERSATPAPTSRDSSTVRNRR